MDPRTWPLSCAATQRLLDLSVDRPAFSDPDAAAELSVKELLFRGALTVDAVEDLGDDDGRLLVSSRPLPRNAPGVLHTLVNALGSSHRRPLDQAVTRTFRRHPNLRQELAAEADRELIAKDLAAPATKRRFLGLGTKEFLGLTPTGALWQKQARHARDQTTELVLADDPTTVSVAELDALGPFIVLIPGGLAVAATSLHAAHSAEATPGAAEGPPSAVDGATELPAAGRHTDLAGIALAFGAVGLAAGTLDSLEVLDSAIEGSFDALDGLATAVGDAAGDAIGGFLDSL